MLLLPSGHKRARAPLHPALQAELNSNLHEQVVLLREQKELSEARAEKSGAEVKKLTAKVRAGAFLMQLPALVTTAGALMRHG